MAKAKSAAAQAAKGKIKAAIPFDIRVPKLPDRIADTALTSGGYPYEKKLKRSEYEEELRLLQIEQLKALDWIKKSGERVVVLFEGRDSAGKGGTIKRVT